MKPTNLMTHKKTAGGSPSGSGLNLFKGITLTLVMTLVVMGCDYIVDQQTEADAGVVTSDISGVLSLVEGSEITCIDPDVGEYHIVSESKTVEWGNRRNPFEKTVEIEYYNTLEQFVLSVKSSHAIADVLVDDESIKNFNGTVEAGTWQEFKFELDEDWQAGDEWSFAVKVAGSGPPTEFGIDYELLGKCSTFFLAENGITISCPDAAVGETGIVNGVEYEAVDRALLIQRRDEGADLTRLCTTPVTDMSSMFFSATTFNEDIGGWDTGNVTNMSAMFANAEAFNQTIGGWNTGNVTNMNRMFINATTFNGDIGGWDTGNVTNMRIMFSNAEAFNEDISGWNTGNVTDMLGMFSGSSSFNRPIGAWDTGNVTNMRFMFSNATAFNQDLSGWCVSLIPSVPDDFDIGAISWVLPNSRPDWGASCSI